MSRPVLSPSDAASEADVADDDATQGQLDETVEMARPFGGNGSFASADQVDDAFRGAFDRDVLDDDAVDGDAVAEMPRLDLTDHELSTDEGDPSPDLPIRHGVDDTDGVD